MAGALLGRLIEILAEVKSAIISVMEEKENEKVKRGKINGEYKGLGLTNR